MSRPSSRKLSSICAAAVAGLMAVAVAAPASANVQAPEAAPAGTQQAAASVGKVLGYFAEWGIYDRNYQVKNIETSGSAAKLTHINYSFGNVTNGGCAIGDSYAATDKAFDAASSVDGVADTWDAPLRGNINQLKKLKAKHPGLKILWSFGGWTWSGGFTQAAQNPTAFANSCYNLVKDPRWSDRSEERRVGQE